MKPPAREWEKRILPNADRDTTLHRNWPVVRWLTIVTVILLLASLPAEFRLGSRSLTIACYIGSAIAGAALLAFLFNERLWVERPPMT